jgi:hypothetical protein
VTTATESACLATFVGGTAWTGYFQQPAAGPEPAGGWEWVSGTASAFTYWVSGQPNNNVDIDPVNGQDCAYLDNAQGGRWYDHECSMPLQSVCER